MSVQPGPTEKRYAANGVSLIYAVPFLVIEAGDLKVYLNGVLQTSGYTHTGVGLPTSTITFSTPPTGDLYLLLDVPFQRLVDYQENGDFLATTVNRDYDRIWQALKQLFRTTTRSPVLGVNDVDGFGAYQAKGNRLANMADPIDPQDAATKNWVGTFIDSVSGLINTTLGIAYDGGNLFEFIRDGVGRNVNSIAALRNLASFRNQRAVVLGYYAPADGGGGLYYFDPADTTSTDNGGTVIVATDGGRWKLNHNGNVSIRQFGARGNWNGTTGADDTAPIQSAVRCGVRNVWAQPVPAGFSYQTTAKVTTDLSVRLHGAGVEPYSVLNTTLGNTRGNGSWFHFNHPDVGFEVKRATPGFTGVTFEGIGTLRAHVIPGGATPFTPTVYAPDFLLDDAGDTWFKNVCTLNPYHALKVQNGQQGRVWIDGLYGQPLFKGTEVIESYDVLRVENVHWWSYWAPVQKVWDYQLANTKPFTSFRSDNPVYDKCFSIFHQIGFVVAGNAFGTTNKLKTSNMDLDRCAYGMIVQPTAIGHTAQHTNFTTQGETGYTAADNIGVLIQADSCDIDFVNHDVRNFRANAIRVDGQFCRVGVVNPNFSEWNLKNTGFAAFEVAVNSVVDVAGSPKYRATNSSLIYSGAGKIRAILAASNFGGSTNASGDVTISHGGLGLPNRVSIQMTSASSIACSVTAKSTSTFTVRFYNTVTGTVLASTALAFDWQCSMA